MRRLDRYLLQELIVPFLIGTVAVVLMFQANTYMYYAKNFDLQNVPMSAVLQVILYRTPEFLNMTLPVGMSLAASLTMSRIARESELTAMRAAGVKILRVILPIAVFGIVVAVGNFLLVEKVIPPATKESNKIAYKVGLEGSLPSMNQNVPLKLGRYAAFLGGVRRTPTGGLDIDDVLLVERPEPGVWYLITSARAMYRNGLWSFHDSYLRRVQGDTADFLRPTDFTLREEILTDMFQSPLIPEEQSLAQLAESIDIAKRTGRATRQYEIKWHVKFAVPAACIVFALVAPVFAVLFARTGGFVGVLVSIVMVLLYYNGFVISTDILGRAGYVPPWLAAWLTNIVFFLLGLLAIRRLE